MTAMISVPAGTTALDIATTAGSKNFQVVDGKLIAYDATQSQLEDAVVLAPLEAARSAKIQQLHKWWDTHPGIEVAAGIVLPIQESGRNTNASSLAIALLTQSETIDLVSVENYTVTVPLANGLTALAVFRAAYDPISQTWDDTHQALLSATTLEALNAVEMPE